MLMRQCGSLGAVIALGLFLQISTGQALAQDRRQECSAKYKTAKTEGNLGGLTWPQFFSRCMAELKAAETPAEAKSTGAVAEPANPLKPVPAAPARPAQIEPVPSPVPSIAEAPAPATPSSPPVEALTATPSTPEIAAPARPTPTPAETTSQMTPTAAPPKVAPVAPAAAPAVPPGTPSAQAPSPAPRMPVFPTAIAPAHAKDKPHIARRKTCLDQYNANKATDSNGGLKWIEKGGGYLSECNKRLKGAS